MKIKIDQPLKDFNGKDQRVGLPQEANNLLGLIFTAIEKETDSATLEKVIKVLEKDNYLQPVATLKDVVMTALMISKETPEEKLHDFKLLQRINNEKEPDLDKTTCEYLYKRVAQHYSSVVTVGRVYELLVSIHDETTKTTKKG